MMFLEVSIVVFLTLTKRNKANDEKVKLFTVTNDIFLDNRLLYIQLSGAIALLDRSHLIAKPLTL
jgi:hypothetical protein